MLSDLHIFEILETNERRKYFSEELTDYTRLYFPMEYPEKEKLLVYILVEATDYFWVYNSVLFNELILERGLDQESIENKDKYYLHYEYSKKFFSENFRERHS